MKNVPVGISPWVVIKPGAEPRYNDNTKNRKGEKEWERDYEQRVKFIIGIAKRFSRNGGDERDEAYFRLNGLANKQNFRYWQARSQEFIIEGRGNQYFRIVIIDIVYWPK